MIKRSKVVLFLALVTSVASPILTATTADAARRQHGYDAYGSASQVPSIPLAEQRWYDRASSPANS